MAVHGLVERSYSFQSRRLAQLVGSVIDITPLKRSGLKRLGGALNRIEKMAQQVRLYLEDETSWYSEDERNVLLKNDALRGRHRGKPCIVIGNGPSLKQQDLRPLAGWVTFAMSGFWKHPILKSWQPTYYCFADPLFFDRSEAMRRFFLEMRERVHHTSYLLPLAGRNSVIEEALLQEDAVVYYVGFQGALYRSGAKRVDLTSTVPAVQSVSQFAIMSAIFMGCSPIYLIGLDHDWLAQRGFDRHFYAGKTIENHPVADGDLGKFSYKDDLISGLRLWEGYERLKIIAAKHGCEIVNATQGGFLDVFDRARYDTIVHRGKSN